MFQTGHSELFRIASVKYEIRISKYETNSKYKMQMLQTGTPTLQDRIS